MKKEEKIIIRSFSKEDKVLFRNIKKEIKKSIKDKKEPELKDEWIFSFLPGETPEESFNRIKGWRNNVIK